MFNVGSAEFLVIALIALIVLGPDKLPEAARKVGNVVAEVRRMSTGFRREMQESFIDPMQAVTRMGGTQITPPKSAEPPAAESGGSPDAPAE